MKTVLFLYTELAEYFLACLEELEGNGYAVHVIRWPVNKEAPFEFRTLSETKFYNREDFNDVQLLEFVNQIQPDVVFTSGWMDKGYLAANQMFKGHVPTVLLLDNHWTGSLKQRLARGLSKWLIHRYFSHAWVPGEYQHLFARKMRFPEANIADGFYCADTRLFDAIYERRERNLDSAPRRLLYVGRYLDFKGVFEMWEAFSQLHADGFSDWELWCAGSGDLWEQRHIHPAIVHHGFVQPAELDKLIKGCTGFLMPSQKEPWGVVLHEMAAAGLPLICSDKVGAATRFLQHGENGFVHEAGHHPSLKEAMRGLMEKTDIERGEMGRKSRKLAESLTPADWCLTLNTFIPQ